MAEVLNARIRLGLEPVSGEVGMVTEQSWKFPLLCFRLFRSLSGLLACCPVERNLLEGRGQG